MRRKGALWFCVAAALLAATIAGAQTPVGTAFTYQGQLKQAGQPFNGPADLLFDLYDASAGGNLLGSHALNGVAVTNGLFTVLLNTGGEFGASAFNGEQRWLAISVNGTPLSPRQELTAAPYAMLATGIALPFSGSSGASGPALAITNSNATGAAISGNATAAAGANFGVVGTLTGASGTDLAGSHSGVWGDSSSGDGVIGTSGALYGAGVLGKSNNVGVYGTNPTGGAGVYGDTVGGFGVYGVASATSGTTYGLFGVSASTDGRAVYGEATAASGTTYGVFGVSDSANGRAVQGKATAGSGTNYGVYGQSLSSSGFGVLGWATATSGSTVGVWGQSDCTTGSGVIGWASATSGATYGVWGRADTNPNGWAVYASGRLGASGTKSFRIDHPDDPQNKYLMHYCTEGPEPTNAYRGRAQLDDNGEAWVELPAYFGEINKDPQVQLTPVGAAMPNLHVAADVQDNAFQIAGGVPQGQVFWRVEAVRNDLWVRTYGAPVEEEKPAAERGKYQHPELYGQPADKGINYRPENSREPTR
jgi:hypothetical protein